jgi:hypothetical protein
MLTPPSQLNAASNSPAPSRQSSRQSSSKQPRSVTSHSQDPIEFLAGLNVSMPLVATCAQEIISLYALLDRYSEDSVAPSTFTSHPHLHYGTSGMGSAQSSPTQANFPSTIANKRGTKRSASRASLCTSTGTFGSGSGTNTNSSGSPETLLHAQSSSAAGIHHNLGSNIGSGTLAGSGMAAMRVVSGNGDGSGETTGGGIMTPGILMSILTHMREMKIGDMHGGHQVGSSVSHLLEKA